MAIHPVLPSDGRKPSALRMKTFSRLDTQPARTPVNASPTPLRTPTHDSGPVWFATPSPYETFIHNTSPAFAGARVPVSPSGDSEKPYALDTHSSALYTRLSGLDSGLDVLGVHWKKLLVAGC